jgi:hypothetical protein
MSREGGDQRRHDRRSRRIRPRNGECEGAATRHDQGGNRH